MQKWINVDQKQISSTIPVERSDGVNLSVSLPPSIVPVAVMGKYDEAKSKFVISFRYSVERDESRLQEASSDGNVQVVFGSKTSRIYEIIVDVDKLEASKIGLELKKAKQKLSNAEPDFSSRNQSPLPTLALAKKLLTNQVIEAMGSN